MKPSCPLAFFRAVAAGAIFGGAPYAFFATGVALEMAEHNDLATTLTLALAPIIIALPIALAGMLTIALPATNWLREVEGESLRTYCAIGATGGGMLSMIVPLLFAGGIDCEAILIIGPGGIVAGLAASFVWARHRMRLKDLRAEQLSVTDNPIHDLLF